VEKKVDNLIIGGGIAGVWLAFQFLKMNKTFVMIDKPGLSISSSVAAGIFNPVLPGRQKKSYNVDVIYPSLGEKYHEMEQLIHEKVFFTPHVSYIFDDHKSLNDWSVMTDSDAFHRYVNISNQPLSKHIITEFGYLDINYSGRVDINTMLAAFKRQIAEPNYFKEAIFDVDHLENHSQGVRYQEIVASQVIFCQGAGMNHNKLTVSIPLKPAKGEILLIKTQDHIEHVIPQNGVFMLPLGNHLFKVGSNFEWVDMTYQSTEKAKEEILRKFTKWYKGDFEVIDQLVGLRPSSEDRRPILGKLPTIEHAYVFNGLGSKGVALAPYYSEMMSRYIYNEVHLDKEVDLKRLRVLK